MALECVNLLRINGEWVEQKDIPKETVTKQKNIEIIIELLEKESPDKVFEVLIFIRNYLS